MALKNQETQKQPAIDYLSKDLKKVIVVCLILIVILLVLYFVDWKTNFLDKLAELLMSKLVGR